MIIHNKLLSCTGQLCVLPYANQHLCRSAGILAAMPHRVCWSMVQTAVRDSAARTASSGHTAPHAVRLRESVTSHSTAAERTPSAQLMCTSRTAAAAMATSLTASLGSVGATMNSVAITGDQVCVCVCVPVCVCVCVCACVCVCVFTNGGGVWVGGS